MSNQNSAFEELEQNARIALLQHYSSKASNEAIIIVTMAIAFFSFIQSLSYIRVAWIVIYETVLLGIIVNVTIRSIARLLGYGYLADSVMGVSISRREGETLLKTLAADCQQAEIRNVTKSEASFGCKLHLRTEKMSDINERTGLACIGLIFLVIFISSLTYNLLNYGYRTLGIISVAVIVISVLWLTRPKHPK
jgi:hypothetical protein